MKQHNDHSYPILSLDPGDYPELMQVWEASVRATHHFLKEEDILLFRRLIPEQYLDAVRLFAVHELHIYKVDVNEQNEQAVGFYRRMGFSVAGRSERDGTGKPYPLLHLIKQSDRPTV